MARRVWAEAALAALMLSTPVLAGDMALFEARGYSPDARYFAFEEFGIQDGSGFPYSSIFVIDLAEDSWVGGSPFRARIDADNASLEAARREAQQAAEDTLVEFAITEPAQLLAAIGDGDPRDATELVFGAAGYQPGMVIGEHALGLEVFEARPAERCSDYTDEAIVGFALTVGTDGVPRELHRDTAVPKSRGCPLAYRLYAVLAPMGRGDIAGSVAIVSVYTLGFEGPDRRFIAVPIGQD